MHIENHQTSDEAAHDREEMKGLLLIVVRQQHLIRKRLIWNSVLALLNLSVLCAIVVLGSYFL